MGLRFQTISDEAWKEQSEQVSQALKTAMVSPAQHLGIRRIQDIFTQHEGRLYHWARETGRFLQTTTWRNGTYGPPWSPERPALARNRLKSQRPEGF